MNADRIGCNITAGGTGALTLGTAISMYRTPAAKGLGASGKTGYVNYLVEWSSGYALGIGTLSSDGLTLTRVREEESDSTVSVVTSAPFRSIPSSGATLKLSLQSRSSGMSTFQVAENAPLVASLDCFVAGNGFVNTGSNNSFVFGRGSVDINCPNSLAIGNGGAWAPFSTAIGNSVAQQYGMSAFGMGEAGLAKIEYLLYGTTTNATAQDLFANLAGTIRPAVIAGTVYLIRAYIVGVISNTSGSIGNVYTRELRAVGKPTGQVGSTVSTAIASDAGFTGSATMSIDGSGNIKVTVTGIASTTINWSAHLVIVPGLATP